MLHRLARSRSWAAQWVALCLLSVSPGCADLAALGFNPSFIALFGQDPVTALPPVTGHVPVLFINKSDTLARMETDVTTTTGATQQLVYEVRAAEYGNKVPQCDISMVDLTSMEVFVDETIEVWGFDETEVGGTTILVPMMRQQFPPQFWPLSVDAIPAIMNVSCGSVISVTLEGRLFIPSLGDIDADGTDELGWLEGVQPAEFPFVTTDGLVPGTTPERQVITIEVR